MMATKHFELFIKQLKATGYQKLQGFDLQAFDKFDLQEKIIAEQQLQELILQKDDTAPEALAALAKGNAIKPLQEALLSAKCPSHFHREVAYALFKLTNDRKYIDEILLELQAKSGTQRLMAVGKLVNTQIDDKLVSVLVDVVAKDHDNIVRGTAARGVLFYYGFISTPKEVNTKYDSILYAIASKDETVKNAGIKELISMITG